MGTSFIFSYSFLCTFIILQCVSKPGYDVIGFHDNDYPEDFDYENELFILF